MERWRLLDLGGLEPYGAQTLYEAVALAVDRGRSPNTIILCYPKDRYVCVGYHQEVEKEIDTEYCKTYGLPIIRRTVGGGATYLDNGQQFYQVVAGKSSIVPARVDDFFRFFLKPPIFTYQQFGVPAEYKPINDIVSNGKKISGNGAGKIESVSVLIGNIILDIDFDLMARVLKVPDEKFRDKIAKSMREWVSSLKKELGYIPERRKIIDHLIEGYKKIGIELVSDNLSEYEEKIFSEEIKPRHTSNEWLYMPQYRHQELTSIRTVKIKGNVKVVEADHKAKKMIRITMEIANETIKDILISGDFFMIPEDASHKLESALIGTSLDRNELLRKIQNFYDQTSIETSGVDPIDFVDVIMKAASA